MSGTIPDTRHSKTNMKTIRVGPDKFQINSTYRIILKYTDHPWFTTFSLFFHFMMMGKGHAFSRNCFKFWSFPRLAIHRTRVSWGAGQQWRQIAISGQACNHKTKQPILRNVLSCQRFWMLFCVFTSHPIYKCPFSTYDIFNFWWVYLRISPRNICNALVFFPPENHYIEI